MCIDTEDGGFRSGCVGGGKSIIDLECASSKFAVGCTDLGGAASATCSIEMVDTVGYVGISVWVEPEGYP